MPALVDGIVSVIWSPDSEVRYLFILSVSLHCVRAGGILLAQCRCIAESLVNSGAVKDVLCELRARCAEVKSFTRALPLCLFLAMSTAQFTPGSKGVHWAIVIRNLPEPYISLPLSEHAYKGTQVYWLHAT
jgi:hypothetical protein